MQCAFHRKMEGIAAPRTRCWNPLRPHQRFKHEHRIGVQTDSCQLKKVLWLFTEDKFKWKMSPQNEGKKVHDTFISKQDILSTHTQAWSSYSKAVWRLGVCNVSTLPLSLCVCCELPLELMLTSVCVHMDVHICWNSLSDISLIEINTWSSFSPLFL